MTFTAIVMTLLAFGLLAVELNSPTPFGWVSDIGSWAILGGIALFVVYVTSLV